MLFGLLSFINHDKNYNVRQTFNKENNLNIIQANRNIKKGEEIVLDYAYGTHNLGKRNKILGRWGISE